VQARVEKLVIEARVGMHFMNRSV